jgi:hypothetical protein
MIGPYVLPAVDIDISLCLTNLVPAAPTRGAGRPQGTFVMERLLDAMAGQLGIGRDEIRRRNLISAAQMPFEVPIKQRDGSLMRYDSGDYPECQRRALALIDWDGFAARRAAALDQIAAFKAAANLGLFLQGAGSSVEIAKALNVKSTTIYTARARGGPARGGLARASSPVRRSKASAIYGTSQIQSDAWRSKSPSWSWTASMIGGWWASSPQMKPPGTMSGRTVSIVSNTSR